MKAIILLKDIKLLSIIAVILMGIGSMAVAQEKDAIPKRILAIFAFKQALPWSIRIEESMRAALVSKSPFTIELNIEHADLPR
jgi:hypothetical protein